MRKVAFLVGSAVLVILLTIISGPLPKVEAQFAGQPAFQIPFTINRPTTQTIIPACTTTLPTLAVPCLPNRNQLGHTLTFTRVSTFIENCIVTLDGSNNNQNWVSLGTANSIQASVNGFGQFSANGYFTFLRLKIPACTASVITGVYTGYAQPIPSTGISLNDFNGRIQQWSIGVGTLSYIVTGFQCFNPNNSATTGTIVFSGAGLNDLSKSGTFSCTGGRGYLVQIDGTGTPDTFRWSSDGGTTFQATGVAITGAAQALDCGVSVTFAATTGHTLNNRWTFNGSDGTAYITLLESDGILDPSDAFYLAAIPPASNFVYPGPPIVPREFILGALYLFASKTWAADATYPIENVDIPIACSLQFNPNGPFYPLNPVSQ